MIACDAIADAGAVGCAAAVGTLTLGIGAVPAHALCAIMIDCVCEAIIYGITNANMESLGPQLSLSGKHSYTLTSIDEKIDQFIHSACETAYDQITSTTGKIKEFWKKNGPGPQVWWTDPGPQSFRFEESKTQLTTSKTQLTASKT